MAVSAYILIQTEVGKAAQVAQEVDAIDGVVSAEDVTGPYDVIARAEAATVDELGKMVVSRVQMIDGITRTLTCPRCVHLVRPGAARSVACRAIGEERQLVGGEPEDGHADGDVPGRRLGGLAPDEAQPDLREGQGHEGDGNPEHDAVAPPHDGQDEPHDGQREGDLAEDAVHRDAGPFEEVLAGQRGLHEHQHGQRVGQATWALASPGRVRASGRGHGAPEIRGRGWVRCRWPGGPGP